MIRNDFVSNSSSSSFIVSDEDNKYDCILQNYTTYNLKEYLNTYLSDEFLFFTYTEDTFNNLKFVSNDVFSRMFSRGFYQTFPNELRDDIKLYIDIRTQYKSNKDEQIELLKKLSELLNIIKEKIFNILKHDWNDVKFHAEEVSDSYFESERDDFVENSEELVSERMNYIDSMKPLKFRREFSHH